MIPAFSGISACMFYLRAFSPSVEIAFNQFKEIESSNIEEKTIFNGKKNYQKDLDIKSNYLILDNVSFSYEQNKKLINNINIKIPKKFICFNCRSLRVRQDYSSKYYNGFN